MRERKKTLLSLIILTVILTNLGLQRSARAVTPLNTEDLTAEAFSAGIELANTGSIVAIEGIRVTRSLVGSFNVIVVYGGSLQNPIPVRLFVDGYMAALLLSLVFEGMVEVVSEGSINVVRVGMAAFVRIAHQDAFKRVVVHFMAQANKLGAGSPFTYVFPNPRTGWVFKATGTQYYVGASGIVDLSVTRCDWRLKASGLFTAFYAPEVKIELTRLLQAT